MEQGGKFVWTQGEEPGSKNPYPCPGKLAERIKDEYRNTMEMAYLGLDEDLPPIEQPRLDAYIDYDGHWKLAY